MMRTPFRDPPYLLQDADHPGICGVARRLHTRRISADHPAPARHGTWPMHRDLDLAIRRDGRTDESVVLVRRNDKRLEQTSNGRFKASRLIRGDIGQSRRARSNPDQRVRRRRRYNVVHLRNSSFCQRRPDA